MLKDRFILCEVKSSINNFKEVDESKSLRQCFKVNVSVGQKQMKSGDTLSVFPLLRGLFRDPLKVSYLFSAIHDPCKSSRGKS